MSKEPKENYIILMPKIGVHIDRFELGEFRIDPNDPTKVIGQLIGYYQLPDPKKCAVIRNVSLPEGAVDK